MRLSAAFFAALSIVFALPAAAQVSVGGGLHNYRIDGWQVRCMTNGTVFTDCTARKSFGRVEATIMVGDDHLHIEVFAPCARLADVNKSRSWDRRQPIPDFDAARILLADLNEKLRACRRSTLPGDLLYEIHGLMFLFLQAVPIPAYVTMGIGGRR
ncbi:MAG TPA: hypothetical protein VK614_13430 [Allosphingosinicella sp.]|nr:hypothetical protein [Allosphingosinicella sp.]